MVPVASDAMRSSHFDMDHDSHYKKGWNNPNNEPLMKEYLSKKYKGHGTTPHHAKQMALNGVSMISNDEIGESTAVKYSFAGI